MNCAGASASIWMMPCFEEDPAAEQEFLILKKTGFEGKMTDGIDLLRAETEKEKTHLEMLDKTIRNMEEQIRRVSEKMGKGSPASQDNSRNLNKKAGTGASEAGV